MTISDFDLTLAKKLATASAAAYEDSPDAIRDELRAETVTTFAGGSIFGYVASSGQDTILAFRGAVSPMSRWEDPIRQWISGLDFHQIAISGGRVHRGFHQALDNVWQQARLLIDNTNSPHKHLWVTGHCLGGALAILAGMRLHDEGFAVSGVYTFGAPAVGDSNFANAYKPPVHRIENACDLICHLPPSGVLTKVASRVLGPLIVPDDAQYESVGKLTVAQENGSLHTVTSPTEKANVARTRLLEMLLSAGADLMSFLEEHQMASYVARLAQGRQSEGIWFPDVPRRLLTTIRNLKRVAGTLRDGAGRIVGFLQETGLLQKLIERSVKGGVILDADEIARNATLDPVRAVLSNLQLLNGATLAASVVGIGVSVAGFALVLNRLNRVELIAKDTHREVVAARLAAERADFQMIIRNKANTLACLEQAELAWKFSDPVAEWKKLQFPLLQQLKYEKCLLGEGGTASILLDGRFAFEEAVSAYESVLVLDSAHFQTLLLIGEENAALANAQNTLAWHRGAVLPLMPDEIARATSKQRAAQINREERDVRLELLRKSGAFKERVHEIDRHMVGRIELIRYLLDKGISGRAYIEECRQRTDTPLMILPAG